MGKVCHLVQNHPMTLCGVNVSEKTGAKWSKEESLTTCQNCLKLLHGGQMGAPPPGSPHAGVEVERVEVDHDRMALQNNLMILETMKTRLHGVETDLKLVLTFIPDGYILENVLEFQQYMDAAHERLKWASANLATYIRDTYERGEV